MNRMLKIVIGLALIFVVIGTLIAIRHKDELTLTPISVKGLNIQTWKASNGAKVLYVHAPQLPMVDIQITYDAGSARDGNQQGLASFTNNMLDMGAGDWDTNTLAERFDSVGAKYSNSAARDMATVSLRSLTDMQLLDKAVSTLAAILNKPQFDPDELERLRNQTLISIKSELQSPSSIASKAYYKALYGSHPYATPVIGTKESVAKFKRAELQRFYERFYVGRNAVVSIVGAVSKAQAIKLVEQTVGELPRGEHAPALPEVQPLAVANTIKQDFPSSQTHILSGQPGMKRNDPDYFPLYVGNHILGGSGFSSLIMQVIRDDNGLAYSSYSYFLPMRVKGPFTMGLQTKNDTRDEALQLLDKVLRDFIANGPTPEQLTHAKKNITGGFPLRIDSNSDIISYINLIGFYDLPLDYLRTYNSKVEAVTIEQIKDAYARRIDPDRLLTVMVGKDL